jgi:hypothetical protein
MMAMAVKFLVIDAIRNTLSGMAFAFDAVSLTPVAPACTSAPSMITPQATPGTFDAWAKLRKALSISGKARASLPARSGSEKRAGGVRSAGGVPLPGAGRVWASALPDEAKETRQKARRSRDRAAMPEILPAARFVPRVLQALKVVSAPRTVSMSFAV